MKMWDLPWQRSSQSSQLLFIIDYRAASSVWMRNVPEQFFHSKCTQNSQKMSTYSGTRRCVRRIRCVEMMLVVSWKRHKSNRFKAEILHKKLSSTFDKSITSHWISYVLWPHNCRDFFIILIYIYNIVPIVVSKSNNHNLHALYIMRRILMVFKVLHQLFLWLSCIRVRNCLLK